MACGCCGGGAADQGVVDLPKKDRGCTDIICLLIYLLHLVGFMFVTVSSLSDTNPARLFTPRDFRGGYCGIDDNLNGKDKLIFMMNVSAMAEPAAKQLVCSSASSAALRSIWGSASTDYNDYLCACCLTACLTCDASLEQEDLTMSTMSGTIGDRMMELTDLSAGATLFSSASSNMVSFSAEDIWSKLTLYLTQVCISDTCIVPTTSNFADSVSYLYEPAADLPWSKAWTTLVDGTGDAASISSVITSSFSFQALPPSRCPYEAKHCIPFPGMEFTEPMEGVCIPQLSPEVVETLSSSTADSLEGLGASELSGALDNTVGSFIETMDALVAISIFSFAIGMVLMVLLRFLVGIAVWGSLICVFLAFMLGGLFVYLRSEQCADGGLITFSFDISALTATGDEELTGDGSSYVGYQTKTRSGKLCQTWELDAPHVNPYDDPSEFAGSPSSIADISNYCRNPSSAGASSIFCYTTDPDMTWELCYPVQLLTQPECESGYMISSEWDRDAMKIVSYIFWGCGGIWLLIVWCMLRQIRLAIAINKVAAMFVMQNPSVLLVPAVKVAIGVLWCIVWMICVSYMVAQVPDDYVPSTVYASYLEAAGTADTPGPCTDKWPTGFVWKDEDNALCSTDEDVPKCWRCGQPRYVLDYKFAYSFFCFLWNNALGVALCQCVIAHACAVWFFKPNEEKEGTAKKGGVWNSVKVCLRYHLGSLAFGSFIVAVVKFIRYCMMYLEKQAKAQKNRVMALVLRVLQCCMWCLEKSIKFLNKNAYIQVALHGTNFCTSAKNAFFLIFNNMARFAVICQLGAIIQFLGWMFVALSTAVLGYFILQAMYPNVFPVLPVMSYFAVGYVVGKLFMSVYAMAVDTCLQCFLADEGKPGSEDRVPKPLKSAMNDPKFKGHGGSASDGHGSAPVAPEPGAAGSGDTDNSDQKGGGSSGSTGEQQDG